MRIERIQVQGLYGIFDHEIVMKQPDRITIIHGPNGYGKTTILRLVNALFAPRYGELRSIPFRLFTVEFSDRRRLEVSRPIGEGKKGRSKASLSIRLVQDSRTLESADFAPVSPSDLEVPTHYFERAVPGLVREDRDMWRLLETNEELSFEEVVERFSDMIPSREGKVQKRPEWLEEIRRQAKVRLVESQRLLRLGKVRPRSYPGPVVNPYEPSVDFYSALLAKAIQSKLAEYAALSQSLDRSFPVRLVAQMQSPQITAGSPPSSEDLRRRLAELEEKRSRLRAAGLLDKEASMEFQVPTELQEPTQRVLPVYVSDVEKKLGVFNEIAEKIDLLQTIISARFAFKSMSINKEKGFAFQSQSGAPLSLTQLSSGEQHMLVLFSELLFGLEPNSLVMIDEPEISLHPAWQQEFLQDLQRVTELVNLDVLIATHSPQIINDRWDLTVELGIPKG